MILSLLADASTDGFNTNSIVISVGTAIILGALAWVGNKSSDNNDKLTIIGASLPYLQTAINELKGQMGGMVTRPELDSKIAEIKIAISKLEIEIIKMQRDERSKTTV